jgi:UDP-glucose 4-epimerase
MHILITGGAGFIGSNLTDRLLADGQQVTVYDNFSTGDRRFLSADRDVTVIEGELADPVRLGQAMAGVDLVCHLAANADVRFGTAHPGRDLEQNTLGTFHVLEAARQAGVRQFAFASTGSVYGEPAVFPTPEDAPFPRQTSLYGASKLAGEGLVQAYAEGFGMRTWIFRFVSVLGPRYSHGHVFDFCRSLRRDPRRLPVLGDGWQRKSYLHVADCVDAIVLALARAEGRVNIFNLGTDGTCTVRDSVGWICRRLGADPILDFSGGARGWVGDSPLIHLDTRRIRALGWTPRWGIREAVERTVDWLLDNPWIFGRGGE